MPSVHQRASGRKDSHASSDHDEPRGLFNDGGRMPVWIYGSDGSFSTLPQLPAEFAPTGELRADYMRLCRTLVVAPHPALRKSGQLDEDHCCIFRSMLVDTFTMHAVSLLLPTTAALKVLIFSGCKLSVQDIHLLRVGLVEPCSVESLQIEWNPFDLPLPGAEEVTLEPRPALTASRSKAFSPSDDMVGTDADVESRERHRYYLQARRSLRGFRDWLASLPRGLDAAMEALRAGGDADAPYSFDDFASQLETRLGISGGHVGEVFEFLDGPDFVAGRGWGDRAVARGKVSLRSLEQAVVACSPADDQDSDGEQDPIGTALASFLDGACVLECLSLRSCAIGRLELKALSGALSARPWNFRVLNLWDNRICDRGVESLAASMWEYRGLEFLGLGRNRITDAGFTRLCGSFGDLVLGEEEAATLREKFRAIEEAKVAEAKAKAKASKGKKHAPTPPPEPAKPAGKRSPPEVEEMLEERPSEVEGEPSIWVLHRPCALKLLMLPENPICSVEAVEAVGSNGPRSGAELVLRGTPAAAALIAKRPGQHGGAPGKPAGAESDGTTGDGGELAGAEPDGTTGDGGNPGGAEPDGTTAKGWTLRLV